MTKEIIIDTEAAIALCQIIDEYETFMKNLKQFTEKNKTGNYRDNKLRGMFRPKPYFSNRKIKKFYKENQIVIDKLKEYIDGDTFVFYFIETTEIAQEFFQYLNRNRKELNKILLTLNQLEQRGFRGIELDETNDFTKTEYKIYKALEQNEEYDNKIYFLENLKRIPTYGTEVIKYQSQGSNYKIEFYYSSYSEHLVWDSIFLNNLTFDVNLLPKREQEDNLAVTMWKEMMASLDTEKKCRKLTH